MRRGIIGIGALIVAAAVLIISYFSIYVVDPTKQALVFRFGQTISVQAQPGLYLRVPFIDNVVYIERRLLDLDSPPLEIIASDQKRLVVDAFARYRVTDSLLFYTSLRNEAAANDALSDLLNSAVRRVLGEVSFTAVVRDNREELMQRITQQVNADTEELGVEVVDVRILRADLPEANSEAVYQRMITQRTQEATQIRSEGQEAAARIVAIARRDAVIIEAEANREAQELRGTGEATANRVLAEAFSSDPEFFAFYRSMLAYQQGLNGNTTTLVLSPNSDFFRYLGDAAGGVPNGSLADLLLVPDAGLGVLPLAPADVPPVIETPAPVDASPAPVEPVAPAPEPAVPAVPAAEPAAPAPQVPVAP